ncbi:MAG: DUF1810 domain-containing protein [Selenomonadaceae bacterium]|nr:DUF1810 domain-containing protein [Selenomonadaceae bacterium]
MIITEQVYNLARFTEAHKESFQIALSEIKNGRKESHWMWYIFPQIKELGHSRTAIYYGIKDLNEAKAFLQDEYLGGNLIEISDALLNLEDDNPVKIFGDIDSKKLKSCMTLFAAISEDDSVFRKVLEKFYNGDVDVVTLKTLNLI